MDQSADKHGANYLFFVFRICIICVCLHVSAFSFVCFVVMWIKLLRKRFGSRDGQKRFYLCSVWILAPGVAVLSFFLHT